jgi:mRNA-degrading endonuclease YafQ of YafQ-DinJ toxin-antitoxin module
MRSIKRIKISSRYKKSFRALDPQIQEKAIEKINIFRESPFDSRLKTHKLHGKDKDCWAFWIDYRCRIKFTFLSENEVLFLDIGPHNIYR